MSSYGQCEKNENGVYLYGSETVVFERDAWGIIVDATPEGSTYATHRCLEGNVDEGYIGYGEYCWVDDQDGEDLLCMRCQAEVPAGVVALIRLHNWDR